MVVIGAALVFPAIGEAADAGSALWGGRAISCATACRSPELVGHAAAGVVVAFAWAPCAGPILGGALLIAAKGGSRAAAIRR